MQSTLRTDSHLLAERLPTLKTSPSSQSLGLATPLTHSKYLSHWSLSWKTPFFFGHSNWPEILCLINWPSCGNLLDGTYWTPGRWWRRWGKQQPCTSLQSRISNVCCKDLIIALMWIWRAAVVSPLLVSGSPMKIIFYLILLITSALTGLTGKYWKLVFKQWRNLSHFAGNKFFTHRSTLIQFIAGINQIKLHLLALKYVPLKIEELVSNAISELEWNLHNSFFFTASRLLFEDEHIWHLSSSKTNKIKSNAFSVLCNNKCVTSPSPIENTIRSLDLFIRPGHFFHDWKTPTDLFWVSSTDWCYQRFHYADSKSHTNDMIRGCNAECIVFLDFAPLGPLCPTATNDT